MRTADFLRVVYFEQHRRQIDPAVTLRRALAPEGDTVMFAGRPVHVNGWARRFLFREEQLAQPVGSLSGGERARVHIARLMLEPADLLLLDEPTNDLDIPTLEVLETSLLEFPGALVLVTHDRYLMDRVATAVLGLDGQGGALIYADLAQWEADRDEKLAAREAASREAARPAQRAAETTGARRKLSYLEQREWDAMEERILEAEQRVEAAQAALQAPETVSDGQRLQECFSAVQKAQAEVEALYGRWAELEQKLG
jgi:ATP-binding cassette subfamily F protein uup